MSEQILIDALCKISSPQGILTVAEMWDIADKALKEFEAAQHGVKADGANRPCANCGLPKSKHPGRGNFCPHRPTAYA